MLETRLSYQFLNIKWLIFFLILASRFTYAINTTSPSHISQCRSLFVNIIDEANSGKDLKKEMSFIELLGKYPADVQKAWFASRNEWHFEKIRAYAQEYSEYSAKLHKELAPDLKKAFSPFGEVSTRPKSENSVLAKMLRADHKDYLKGGPGIQNYQEAVAAIGDGIGARILLKADQNGVIDKNIIQGFVDKVAQDIKQGTRVTIIENYRAQVDGIPYLNYTQIDKIIRADQDYRLGLGSLKTIAPDPLIVKNGEDAYKKSGFTGFQMNILYQDRIQIEIQVQGKLMSKYNETEHFYHDLRSGKVLSEKHAQNPVLVSAVNSFKKLSPSEREQILNYSRETLLYARQLEVGLPIGSPPTIPPHLPQELSYENLSRHLHHD